MSKKAQELEQWREVCDNAMEVFSMVLERTESEVKPTFDKLSDEAKPYFRDRDDPASKEKLMPINIPPGHIQVASAAIDFVVSIYKIFEIQNGKLPYRLPDLIPPEYEDEFEEEE